MVSDCRTCPICDELAYIPPDREVCDICNQGFVYFNNDINVMHNALAYLIASKQKE